MVEAQPRSIIDYRPRCERCGRVLGEQLTRPWQVRCSKSTCKKFNTSPTLENESFGLDMKTSVC